jgi:hypothetical protein
MILLPLPLSFVPSSYNHYKPLTMSMGCEKEEKRKEKEKDIFHFGVADSFWNQSDE